MNNDFPQLDLRTEQLRAEMQDLTRLADSFGHKLVAGFAGALIHGRSLSDVMRKIGLQLANQALSSALAPVGNLVGGLFGKLLPNAHGNVLHSGAVTPFADGGIVNSPLLFPMRGGTGLLGEAGPEAILPLARGRDGRLGVRNAGGGQTHVTVNISTPDASSFHQAQGQIAALMTRSIIRGQRNL
jgi:phage-related minor tail protein